MSLAPLPAIVCRAAKGADRLDHCGTWPPVATGRGGGGRRSASAPSGVLMRITCTDTLSSAKKRSRDHDLWGKVTLQDGGALALDHGLISTTVSQPQLISRTALRLARNDEGGNDPPSSFSR